jgi:hypothetical protein
MEMNVKKIVPMVALSLGGLDDILAKAGTVCYCERAQVGR